MIQQLYLQVCNIGKNLKEEMSQEKDESLRAFNKNLLKTVESQIEMFTSKQTTIIERWSRAEARSREDKKNKEYLDGFKRDVDILIGHSEDIFKEKYRLLRPNTREVEVEQELVVRTNITITRISQLMEEVRTPGNYYRGSIRIFAGRFIQGEGIRS